ncbi:hypothetical protein LOAG_07333 [Loa loa]|uniref:DUF4806 domain-containing protein n=1 Tax=Loa loa TaxID=7209 RepID=A0A1I7VLH1_LOALO|nr:hypothetical protein LOAG_07333 [Loa loa]EFO21153.1 hypothetical protein LOAG_07333 [Loa loa]
MFDNSRNKPNYPTSTSLYDKNVVIEGWGTSPPHKVVGTVILTPNAVREAKEKVISTIKECDIVYSSSDNGKDELYMHGIDEQPEESDSTSSSKRDEINEMNSNSEEMISNRKTHAGNSITNHNSSACYFFNSYTNSTITITLESTISTSSTVNDTLKKISNKLDHEKFASDLRIIDIMGIFNILATFIEPTLSSDVTSTTHYSSLSDNSTFRNANDEFSNVDTQSDTHVTGKTLDRSFSQLHRSEGQLEISRMKGRGEHTDDEHSGENININNYGVVKGERDYKNFEKNSKLNPQMIPRSDIAKSGINEENKMISNCGIDHIGTSKKDSGQLKSSNCETVDETKIWEPRDVAYEKYDDKDEKHGKSVVLVHFERTLWEKLVAGLKCSQRDCREALRPTENIRKYLIEPSISRARKHSSG